MIKVELPSTSVMVTEFCSLRCKLCLAYIPYYKEYRHMNLNVAKKIIKRYFNIVDFVDKFSITGGEPLLNPELDLILLEIFRYSSQIKKEIILITNGTILLKDELINILKQNRKIKVIVNNYEGLSLYAEKNYEILCSNGINAILYTEDNRYGWIDCRDHTLKHATIEDCIKQAKCCEFFRGKKYVISRGNLYTCTRAAYRIQENIITYTDSDYLDLLCDEESFEADKQKLNKMLNAEYTVSCAYCDGLTKNSKKYRAAEQIKLDEIV